MSVQQQANKDQDSLSPAVKNLKTSPKQKHTKPNEQPIGHTLRSDINKDLIEKNKKIIFEVYDEYTGDDLEELSQLLTKRGIHVHRETDPKDRDTPVARAFYHDPVSVVSADKKFTLNGFYADLKLPKETAGETEETPEENPKKSRSLFGKKR